MTSTKIKALSLIEVAEAKRDELIEARALASQRKVEAEKARDRLDEIDTALDSGDGETHSFEDYRSADAASTFADKLLLAAESKVVKLEREQTNMDLRAAEALVPIVASAMRGRVPVVARIGKKTDDLTDEEVPSIILTQAEPSRGEGGIISEAKVFATYVRDDLMASLPSRSIEKEAASKHQSIELTRYSIGEGTSRESIVSDEFLIKVYQAWEPTFRLGSLPTRQHADDWAHAVARIFANAVQHDTKSMRMDGDPLRIARTLDVQGDLSTAVSGSEVTTTASASFMVKPGYEPVHASPGDRWDSLPDELVGKPFAHLGICTGFTVESRKNDSRDTGYSPSDRWAFRVKATFAAEVVA